ncbi:dihydrofolate reductase-like domain-containing protein [Lineolata rhizophorae]|uniref:Dihydrofolate reductase n=1 Tax=Lineolata rhizophorae TaxID=578093 RepID=A0A6A6NX79_9PEZI|nr:dihydrofolate reductase-like domain-containing protein [Lineolata rhizophorae]
MPSSPKPLTLIVAATATRRAIGRAGTLPWGRLPDEMAYFASVTRRVSHPALRAPHTSAAPGAPRRPRNAVVMGRRTWESIPARFRPLAGRVNVVLSRSGRDAVRTLENVAAAAAEEEETDETAQATTLPPVARIFVIGGSAVYEAALRHPRVRSVLLTKVHREYEDADTFFPVDLDRDAGWTKRDTRALEAFADQEGLGGMKRNGDVEFEFCLYEKCELDNAS